MMSLTLQGTLLELSHDSSVKDEFRANDLEDFCVNVRWTYQQLTTKALKTLIQFSTTYLISPWVLLLPLYLRIRHLLRNRLEVKRDICCALYSIAPHTEAVMNKEL